MVYTKSVEKWGVFEFSYEGTTAGNPFLERGITGTDVNTRSKLLKNCNDLMHPRL